MCESGGNLHTHTHLNSAKHNINEINKHPKGSQNLLGVFAFALNKEKRDGK